MRKTDRDDVPFTERLLFTREQAAVMLGVSVQTVSKYIRTGELEAVRMDTGGRSVYVPRWSMDAFVKSRPRVCA